MNSFWLLNVVVEAMPQVPVSPGNHRPVDQQNYQGSDIHRINVPSSQVANPSHPQWHQKVDELSSHHIIF